MTTANDFLNVSDIQISLSCDQEWADPHRDLNECMTKEEIDTLWEESNDNPWKWGSVTVTAKYTDPQGKVFSFDTYLGCCSYDNEADFIRSADYYECMVNEAIEGLVKSLQ